jgi:hypothetical protein
MTVDREGGVSLGGDLRVLYATMLKTRFFIISNTRFALQSSLLIAIRYSIARR